MVWLIYRQKFEPQASRWCLNFDLSNALNFTPVPSFCSNWSVVGLSVVCMNWCHITEPKRLWISLLFIVFYPCNILIIYLYSNKLHSIDIFYKQHIQIFVLSKTLKTSPTCFGHYLTIIREILYLSELQLLKYWCSSMPVVMCVLGHVLCCYYYAVPGIPGTA